MPRKLILILSLFALGLPAGATLAQSQSQYENDDENDDGGSKGRIEITPFIGPRTHGAFRTGEQTDNRFVEVDGSASFGTFVGYGLTDNLVLEGLFAHQGSQVIQGDAPTGTEPEPRIVEPGQPLFDIGIDYFHGGVLYGGGSDVFSGYAAAGAGLARLSPDLPSTSTINKFSFSLGIGFRMFFAERIGFRFDARAFGLRAGESEEVVAEGGVFDPVTFKRASTFWQTHFVAGVVIRL